MPKGRGWSPGGDTEKARLGQDRIDGLLGMLACIVPSRQRLPAERPKWIRIAGRPIRGRVDAASGKTQTKIAHQEKRPFAILDPRRLHSVNLEP